MNTKNTKINMNMKKSTPEVAKSTEVKTASKAKAEAKPVVKADRPKLTAAYIKEMVAKGLSPLTGKPIRHYSRAGKRYAGKDESAGVKTEVKPVTEKVEAKVVKAEAKPVTEKVEAKTVEAPTKAEASKPAIPVLKAKKTVKKAKKA